MTTTADRLTRLEELTWFQEERIQELDAALAAQQRQLDRMEQDLADALAVIGLLRNKLAERPANVLPPHFQQDPW